MRKNSANKLEGNDRYEGYAVDLIKELSQLSNFKYKFTVQEDGANGQLVNCPNGSKLCWDGMMGKVYHGVSSKFNCIPCGYVPIHLICHCTTVRNVHLNILRKLI